jgi:hypothetical protein
MVRVQCKICQVIGYTASPRFLICKCGGSFRVIPEPEKIKRTKVADKAEKDFSLSGILCGYGYLKSN